MSHRSLHFIPETVDRSHQPAYGGFRLVGQGHWINFMQFRLDNRDEVVNFLKPHCQFGINMDMGVNSKGEVGTLCIRNDDGTIERRHMDDTTLAVLIGEHFDRVIFTRCFKKIYG